MPAQKTSQSPSTSGWKMTLRLAAIIGGIVVTLCIVGIVVFVILILSLNPEERAIIDSLQFTK